MQRHERGNPLHYLLTQIIRNSFGELNIVLSQVVPIYYNPVFLKYMEQTIMLTMVS